MAGLLEAIGGSAVGLAGIGTGYLNYMSQRENQAYQRDAAKNMMQWRVADLRKAGLNPVLASGAASQSMPVSIAPQMDSGGVSQGIATAIELMRAKKDIEVSQSQIDLNKANANRSNAEALMFGQTYSFNELFNPGLLEAQALENNYKSFLNPLNIEKVKQEIEKLGYDTAKAQADAQSAEIGVTRQEVALARDKIARAADTVKLSQEDELLIAQRYANEKKLAELDRYKRDSDLYKNVDVPSDQRWGDWLQRSNIFAHALKGLLGGRR